MKKNFETLQIGGFYLSKDKEIGVLGPIKKADFCLYSYRNSYWNENGKSTLNSEYDLIQKVEVTIAPVEQKKEIKLFVGAVCKRKDGEIIIIAGKSENCELMPFYCFYRELIQNYTIDGKFVIDEHPLKFDYQVIEILNPEANYNKE